MFKLYGKQLISTLKLIVWIKKSSSTLSGETHTKITLTMKVKLQLRDNNRYRKITIHTVVLSYGVDSYYFYYFGTYFRWKRSKLFRVFAYHEITTLFRILI